ncbi:MAG: hypothetical protein KJ964_09790 [Verrucomicrobia bacterium]|nr:hypothetical protein [Verrucomicrobiota bacterium]MBU1735593.1 hypothetical protein [Verrucomicrobiota bacterium]MBU1856703.1 hypothetical protein [Verrucomicrobiota bacterium]
MKIRKFQLFLLFFFVLVCIGAYCGTPKPSGIDCRLEKAPDYKTEPFVPMLDIPRLTAPPKIDGAIAENEWTGSAFIGNFLTPTTTNNTMPATKCRLGFDDQALYLAFRCELDPGTTPQAKAKTRDGPVYDDDSIEFFIWPDGSKSNDYQVAVNSIGTCFDAKYLSDPVSGAIISSDNSWNPQWETATLRAKDGWTMEMAIPWKSLEIETKGIKGIRFNICRNVVPGSCRYSSWAYLPKLSFHMPDRFGIGICRFDPTKRQIDDISETGLGIAGLLRTEKIYKNGFTDTSQRTEVVCSTALTSHPLFAGQKCRLIIDGNLLDRQGRQQPESTFEIAGFEISSSIPQKLIIVGSGLENYLLNLRAEIGNVTNCQQSLVVIPSVWSEINARFRKVDLAALAQKEPFKAAGYMGAAGCVEKLRSGASSVDMFRNLREVMARLDVLENGKTDVAADRRLQILNLAGHPEAQVVIEYPSSSRKAQDDAAEITFYWGAIPLGTVWNTPLSRDKTNEWFGGKTDLCVFEGNTARIRTNAYGFSYFYLKDFDPARQALLIKKIKSGNYPLVLNIADLDFSSLASTFGRESLKVAITSLPGCPSNVSETVKTWASKEGLMSLSFDEAIKSDAVLVTGDVRQFADKLGIAKQNINILFKQAKPSVRFEVLRGREVFTIWSAPTRTFAEMALRLVMAGKPVLPSEVDALRLEIVKAMAPEIKQCALPDGLRLFCGDVHMHTTFSDGATPPLATALETMYCFMDFAVMSDHNTTEGAVLAQNLLREHGFSYPLIVGEEITTGWAHLNAYPLREVVLPTLTPEETIKAAHRQGAVVQWNHPGYTGSDFEMAHLMTGLAGTGCDAWEHTFWLYDTWKASGKLPVMVGATDTHSGTFGWPERTLILTPSPNEDDLAEAIRRAKVVMVSPQGGNFFYGSDEMLTYTWSALKEGKTLKVEKAEHLKNIFKHADITGLLIRSGNKK